MYSGADWEWVNPSWDFADVAFIEKLEGNSLASLPVYESKFRITISHAGFPGLVYGDVLRTI